MGKTFIMLHILQQPQTLLTALKEQVNLGQLATETYKILVFSSQRHCQYYCQSSSPLPFSLHLLWSVASLGFNCRTFMSLFTTSFCVFLGLPLCLAASTSKVTCFTSYPDADSQIMDLLFYRGTVCSLLSCLLVVTLFQLLLQVASSEMADNDDNVGRWNCCVAEAVSVLQCRPALKLWQVLWSSEADCRFRKASSAGEGEDWKDGESCIER